jgi:hypothetical protein
MTTKEQILHLLEELPDDATWDEVLERIYFVAGVRKGLQELNAGEGIAHERIREEYAAWLTD